MTEYKKNEEAIPLLGESEDQEYSKASKEEKITLAQAPSASRVPDFTAMSSSLTYSSSSNSIDSVSMSSLTSSGVSHSVSTSAVTSTNERTHLAEAPLAPGVSKNKIGFFVGKPSLPDDVGKVMVGFFDMDMVNTFAQLSKPHLAVMKKACKECQPIVKTRLRLDLLDKIIVTLKAIPDEVSIRERKYDVQESKSYFKRNVISGFNHLSSAMHSEWCLSLSKFTKYLTMSACCCVLGGFWCTASTAVVSGVVTGPAVVPVAATCYPGGLLTCSSGAGCGVAALQYRDRLKNKELLFAHDAVVLKKMHDTLEYFNLLEVDETTEGKLLIMFENTYAKMLSHIKIDAEAIKNFEPVFQFTAAIEDQNLKEQAVRQILEKLQQHHPLQPNDSFIHILKLAADLQSSIERGGQNIPIKEMISKYISSVFEELTSKYKAENARSGSTICYAIQEVLSHFARDKDETSPLKPLALEACEVLKINISTPELKKT